MLVTGQACVMSVLLHSVIRGMVSSSILEYKSHCRRIAFYRSASMTMALQRWHKKGSHTMNCDYHNDRYHCREYQLLQIYDKTFMELCVSAQEKVGIDSKNWDRRKSRNSLGDIQKMNTCQLNERSSVMTIDRCQTKAVMHRPQSATLGDSPNLIVTRCKRLHGSGCNGCGLAFCHGAQESCQSS